MRLGAQPVDLADGTRARSAYGETVVYERHRHRYEVNNHYRPRLVEAGLVVSGTYQEGRLVEVIELPDHPWFVASQFHPEFKSRPTRPAPLFRDFVGAALERARSRAPRRPRHGRLTWAAPAGSARTATWRTSPRAPSQGGAVREGNHSRPAVDRTAGSCGPSS